MKNKKLWLLCLLVFFSLFALFLLNKKNKNTNQITQFPISPYNEFYTMKCNFIKIHAYHNYDQLPALSSDWKSLADISCSYFDLKKKKQVIKIPLRVYNSKTQEYFMFGTDIQKKEEEEVKKILQSPGGEDFYIKAIKKLYGANLTQTSKVLLFVSFPNETFAGNGSHEAGFELLKKENPPYTKNELDNFYETGSSNFLPKINGYRYFWPIIGYKFE